MVSASVSQCGLRRFFASAALLALGACGSDQTGSTTNKNTLPAASGYVYVASAGDSAGAPGAIYEYGMFADSSISPLPQPSIAAGVYPAAVVTNQFNVYVVNVGDGTISQYTVGFDGTLTPMSPATVTNPGMHTFGAAPVSAIVDPTGSFLYVSNAADNTLSQFSIGDGGQLTPLTPSTVATEVDPVSLVGILLADGTPAYYVVNSGAAGETGTVSLYLSAENGTLSPLRADTVAAGTNPSAIAMNDAAANVYVTSNCEGAQCVGSIRQFAVGDGGALTEVGTIATTGSHYDAVNLVINQDGTNAYAYVLTNERGVDTTSGALWQYEVENTGQLIAASPPMLNTGSVAVAQVLKDASLYVLTTNSGASANGAGSGGNINVYGLGAGGVATLTAATKLVAPYPVTMGMLFLLAP